jgi:hypothetical protein
MQQTTDPRNHTCGAVGARAAHGIGVKTDTLARAAGTEAVRALGSSESVTEVTADGGGGWIRGVGVDDHRHIVMCIKG